MILLIWNFTSGEYRVNCKIFPKNRLIGLTYVVFQITLPTEVRTVYLTVKSRVYQINLVSDLNPFIEFSAKGLLISPAAKCTSGSSFLVIKSAIP